MTEMAHLAGCKRYDNLMSLKLDGALDAEKEHLFENHVANCARCAPLWKAMVEADALIWGWVAEPLPVPSGFHVKVMAQVATSPMARPQMAPAYVPGVSQPTRPLSMTGPLGGSLTGPLTMRLIEWQGRVAPYLRWVATAALALTGLVGIVLALVVSGALTFEGDLAGVAGAFRTFFQVAETWARSLFSGIGPIIFVVAGIVMTLLLLAGWQVVSSYYRSVTEQRRGNTGYLEVPA